MLCLSEVEVKLHDMATALQEVHFSIFVQAGVLHQLCTCMLPISQASLVAHLCALRQAEQIEQTEAEPATCQQRPAELLADLTACYFKMLSAGEAQ